MSAGLDSTNAQIGQKQQKKISVTGEAEVISDSGIEIVDGPSFEDTLVLEKFMNEPVKILVFPPTQKGEEYVVPLSVNGVTQYVMRNRPQIVKRKYVEVLARARKAFISADGYQNPQTGEAENVVNINHTLQYPFQVLEDRNPIGNAWLEKIFAEV